MIDTIVLGARDPEMDAVGRVALNARLNVLWAHKNGRPVAYDQMYSADWPLPAPGQLWVECSPAAGKAGLDFSDHHNPGDPGFNKPPEEFWEASSLGQVWSRIHPDKSPPEALRIIAATDHCPHAAYRGDCRGIDPGNVVSFSAEQIALSNDLSVKDVLRDVYRFIHKIKSGKNQKVAGTEFYHHKTQITTNHAWLVLREAALWHGIGVVAPILVGREEWLKVAGHTTPKFIKTFMEGALFPSIQMTRVYGDPSRGYAGGLVGSGPG